MLGASSTTVGVHTQAKLSPEKGIEFTFDLDIGTLGKEKNKKQT